MSAMLDGWTQGAQAQHQESGDQAGASSFCGVFLVLVTCSHALCSHKLVAWSGSPPYPSCCPRSFQCVSLLSFDGKGVMGWAGLSSRGNRLPVSLCKYSLNGYIVTKEKCGPVTLQNQDVGTGNQTLQKPGVHHYQGQVQCLLLVG